MTSFFARHLAGNLLSPSIAEKRLSLTFWNKPVWYESNWFLQIGRAFSYHLLSPHLLACIGILIKSPRPGFSNLFQTLASKWIESLPISRRNPGHLPSRHRASVSQVTWPHYQRWRPSAAQSRLKLSLARGVFCWMGGGDWDRLMKAGQCTNNQQDSLCILIHSILCRQVAAWYEKFACRHYAPNI